MANPVAAYVKLPDDTGNTGKQVRTQTRTINGQTVHEHFMINISARNTLGKYKTSSLVLTVPSAVQNGTSTGYLWIFNPIGSTVKMAIKRAQLWLQFNALAVDLLAGELRVSTFTYTGTPSGAQLTPSKRRSSDAAPQCQFRTASTGMAVSLVATVMSFLYNTMDLATGGAGHWNPSWMEWLPDEEEDEIVLLPGEGIVFWHAAAVTAANRRLIINTSHEEFEENANP